MTAKTNST